MPFKSKKQKKTIDAAAHNPAFAKKIGIKVSDAKKMSAHGKGQTKFEEAKDTVEKDEKGNVKSWKHEGDWEKSKNKEGRGKVTNLSDKARRKTEKLSKAETEMAEAFETAMEGSIRGGVWTSQPPDKGQKDVPPPTEPDGGILNKQKSAPKATPKPVKKAENGPEQTGVEADTEVAEGKQSYSGGNGKKITKSEHEANKKVKKEKDKFKKMAEALVQIGRLEQMIVEAKKAKKDYDKDGKIESEKDEVIGSRRKAAGLDESKPDYIDLDKDGNKKEPMKKAAKDAKAEKQVGESSNRKVPKGLTYSGGQVKKRPELVAAAKHEKNRKAAEKRKADKEKAEKEIAESKAKCSCEESGKSKCAVHGKKKDKYMESLFQKLDNQLNG